MERESVSVVEKYSVDVDNMLDQLKNFGYDLGNVSKIGEPEEAIETLLGYLGGTFQCERVYIFEKNKQGNYDCSTEWCSDQTLSKKHLLQNLEEKTVRYYYNYFLRGKALKFRNIEEFKDEDYFLYKILKPQNLYSLLCGQLIYDDKDAGFIGIDNPIPEKFDELENIFEVISYFISVQIHKKNVMNRIAKDSKSVQLIQPQNYSLYHRVSELKLEEPLTIIYCNVMNVQLLKMFLVWETKTFLSYVKAEIRKKSKRILL